VPHLISSGRCYGNTATGYTGKVSFSSSDAKAVLPGSYTFTSANHGMQTFSATLNTPGTQSLTVKDTASHSSTEPGITVTAAGSPPGTGSPPPAPAVASGQDLDLSMLTWMVVKKKGRRGYQLVLRNGDPNNAFTGLALFQGLTADEARALHLPRGTGLMFVSLPPGGFGTTLSFGSSAPKGSFNVLFRPL
jgi:hypothetical protein